MMMQMFARAEIHKHSDFAWEALRKESKQMIDKHMYIGYTLFDMDPAILPLQFFTAL